MSDLSLVPASDLIEALVARYDHFILMGIKVLREHQADNPRENTGTMQYTRRWAGHSLTCAGMCDDIQNKVLTELRHEEEPAATDE